MGLHFKRFKPRITELSISLVKLTVQGFTGNVRVHCMKIDGYDDMDRWRGNHERKDQERLMESCGVTKKVLTKHIR